MQKGRANSGARVIWLKEHVANTTYGDEDEDAPEQVTKLPELSTLATATISLMAARAKA